jgi:quercetin dioxygenase-like cupin family protein
MVDIQYEIELARYGVKKEKEETTLNVPTQVLPSEAKEEISKIATATSTVKELTTTAEKVTEEKVVGVALPKEIIEEIPTTRITIHLDKIIKTEGKEGDIELKPGDTITIPKIPKTVMIVGAVTNPGNVVYEENKKINYYIDKVGGYSEDANRKKIIVIKPNGEVISGKKIKNISRGDIIIVPPKPLVIKERKDWWEKTKDVVKLITDTATAVFVIRSMERVATK